MANLYDQIPKDGYPKAPTADGSQNNPLNTEVGRNLSNLASAIPGAAGVPGAVAMGTGLAARALGASAPAVGVVGRAAQAAAPYAPVAAGAVALNSATSTSSAPPPSVTPSPTPAPLPTPETAPAPTNVQAPGGTTGNVTRVGNTYSGTNVTGDITVNGQAPRGGFMVADGVKGGSAASPVGMSVQEAQQAGLIGERVGYDPAYDTRLTGQDAGTAQATRGQVSPRNMAAADALAASQTGASTSLPTAAQPGVATPVTANSTNDWAARNNLRNLAVSASSITANGGRFDQSGRGDSPEVAAYKAALTNDHALQQAQPGLAAVAMRENGGLQREGMQQQGANTRSLGQIALEQQKINQAGESQGFANRAAGRLEALQTAYQTAKTPEERSTLAQQIRGIQGRNDPAEWGVQVTPTTKNIDGSTSMGSIVRYNKATGQTEVVQQPVQGGGAQPSANHLAALKANPKQAAQFDEVYGPGAAARALKGG